MILFDKKEFHFSISDLPALVSYKEKTGGSQFSIAMIADLYLQGEKVIFYSAYSMAKDSFLKQAKGNIDESKITLLNSGDQKALENCLNKYDEHIYFIKNFELLNRDLLKKCLKQNKFILSGNLDECYITDETVYQSFNSQIFFSEPNVHLPYKVPILNQYQGYLHQADNNGFLELKL